MFDNLRTANRLRLFLSHSMPLKEARAILTMLKSPTLLVLLFLLTFLLAPLTAVLAQETQPDPTPQTQNLTPVKIYRTRIDLGKWDRRSFNEMIKRASKIHSPGERIAFVSAKFLGAKYEENTMVGGPSRDEELIIKLSGMDCFTYLDYVEAIRISNSYAQFKENLKKVRYHHGAVDYRERNHFFLDWRTYSTPYISDVTMEVGGKAAKKSVKKLNAKEDGSVYLNGIAPKMKIVVYIPSEAITDEVVSKLETGDYLGVYTDINGLDASHTGIFIRKGDNSYIRHASSKKATGKVVDEDFAAYFSTKPGLIVLRPQ